MTKARRSLLIGSPLLNSIREGASRSLPGVLPCSMTAAATRVMKELAPRVFQDHSSRLYGSDVTVRVFTSPETSAGFLVKTTCSTTDGPAQLRQLIEFCFKSASQLSALLVGFPKTVTGLAADYRVWISPLTFARGQTDKREPSSVGYLVRRLRA